LVKSSGEAVVYVSSCVGGEGESEFDVFPGGVLAGGVEVTDEMVDLLEGKVCAVKVVDWGIGFQGVIKGYVKAGVGKEEGKEDVVILVEVLETRSKDVGGVRHSGLFLRVEGQKGGEGRVKVFIVR